MSVRLTATSSPSTGTPSAFCRNLHAEMSDCWWEVTSPSICCVVPLTTRTSARHRGGTHTWVPGMKSIAVPAPLLASFHSCYFWIKGDQAVHGVPVTVPDLQVGPHSMVTTVNVGHRWEEH